DHAFDVDTGVRVIAFGAVEAGQRVVRAVGAAVGFELVADRRLRFGAPQHRGEIALRGGPADAVAAPGIGDAGLDGLGDVAGEHHRAVVGPVGVVGVVRRFAELVGRVP